jgi:hypothetical protein
MMNDEGELLELFFKLLLKFFIIHNSFLLVPLAAGGKKIF